METTNVEQKKESKKGFWSKAAKLGKATLKVAIPLGLGAAAGWFGRRYVDSPIYDAAKKQFEFEERKMNKNN